jgi:hypothetical protein
MPGRPSTISEIESPTGCTKQLISVAQRSVPAAELMRPAGTKPFSCASRKRVSQWRALVFGFDRGQGAGHAAAHVAHIAFGALGIFFDQDFAGNFLRQEKNSVIAKYR